MVVQAPLKLAGATVPTSPTGSRDDVCDDVDDHRHGKIVHNESPVVFQVLNYAFSQGFCSAFAMLVVGCRFRSRFAALW